MKIHFDLEMLAVLLLLTPIISDGVMIQKCDLMRQLESAIPEETPNQENWVAKIMCYVGNTSHFETSFIHESNPQNNNRPRKARGIPRNLPPNPKLSEKSIQTSPEAINPPPNPNNPLSETAVPPPQSQASALPPNQPRINRLSENSSSSAVAPLPPPNSTNTITHQYEKKIVELGTLYGVFQLACSMCSVSCNKLIDDDITDDTNCLLTILGILPGTNPADQVIKSQELIKEWKHMFQDKCFNADYTKYLDDCKNP